VVDFGRGSDKRPLRPHRSSTWAWTSAPPAR